MEECKNSSIGNHETKKSARVVHGDGKSVRVVSNQKYKHKNAKSEKDTESRPPNGNSTKKNKQKKTCSDLAGEAKSCKANMLNCVTGLKDPGSSIEDQRPLCKTKKSSHLVAAAEKLTPASGQEVTEVSSPQNMENGVEECTLAVSPSEAPPEIHKLNAGTDSPVDSAKIDQEQSAIQSNSEDLEKKEISMSDEQQPVIAVSENGSMLEDTLSPEEQKLGLKQAEERLERDYIFRLEKILRTLEVNSSQLTVKAKYLSPLLTMPTAIIYASSVKCTSKTSRERTST